MIEYFTTNINYFKLLGRTVPIEQWLKNLENFKIIIKIGIANPEIEKLLIPMLLSSGYYQSEFEVKIWLQSLEESNIEYFIQNIQDKSKGNKDIKDVNLLTDSNQAYLFRVYDTLYTFIGEKILEQLDQQSNVYESIIKKKNMEFKNIKEDFMKFHKTIENNVRSIRNYQLYVSTFFYQIEKKNLHQKFLTIEQSLRLGYYENEFPKDLSSGAFSVYFDYLVHHYDEKTFDLIKILIDLYPKENIIYRLLEYQSYLELLIHNVDQLEKIIKIADSDFKEKLTKKLTEFIEENKEKKSIVPLFIGMFDQLPPLLNQAMFQKMIKYYNPKTITEVIEKLEGKPYQLISTHEIEYFAENSSYYGEILYKYMFYTLEGKIQIELLQEKDKFSMISSKKFKSLLKGSDIEKKIASLLILKNSNYNPKYNQDNLSSLQIPFAFTCLFNVIRNEKPNFDKKEISKKLVSLLKEEDDSFYLQKSFQLMMIQKTLKIKERHLNEIFEDETFSLNRFYIIKYTLPKFESNQFKRKFFEKLMKEIHNQVQKKNHKNIEIYMSEMVNLLDDKEIQEILKDLKFTDFINFLLEECENTLLFLVLKKLIPFFKFYEELLERINENFEAVLEMINKEQIVYKEEDSHKNLFYYFLNRVQDYKEDIKCKVTETDLFELIYLLLENSDEKSVTGKATINRSFLPKIMKKYNGSLSQKDSIIYEIFNLYEMKFNIHLYEFDYNYGKFNFTGKSQESMWTEIKSESYRFRQTLHYFPHSIELYKKNENYSERDIDIRFFLRLMTWMNQKGRNDYHCIDSGALALVLMCMSCTDIHMRKLAGSILIKTVNSIEYESSKIYPKETKQFYKLFLLIIKNSIEEDDQRIPGYYNAFFTSVLPLIKDYNNIFYSKLANFTLNRLKFDFNEFFYIKGNTIERSLLESQDDYNSTFYISVLVSGIKSKEDFTQYAKNYVFSELMNAYVSCNRRQRTQILKLFENTFLFNKNYFHRLIQSDFFLSFLRMVLLRNRSLEDREYIMNFIRLIYTLRNVSDTLKILETESYFFFEILKDIKLYQSESYMKLLYDLYTFPKTKPVYLQISTLNKLLEKTNQKDLAVEMILNIKFDDTIIFNKILEKCLKESLNNERLLKKLLEFVNQYNHFELINETNTKTIFSLYNRVPYFDLEKELNVLFKKRKRIEENQKVEENQESKKVEENQELKDQKVEENPSKIQKVE